MFKHPETLPYCTTYTETGLRPKDRGGDAVKFLHSNNLDRELERQRNSQHFDAAKHVGVMMLFSPSE